MVSRQTLYSMDPIGSIQSIATKFLNNIYASPVKFLVPGTTTFGEAMYPLAFIVIYALLYSFYGLIFIGEDMPLGEALGEDTPLGEEFVSEEFVSEEFVSENPLEAALGFIGDFLGEATDTLLGKKAPGKKPAAQAKAAANRQARRIRRTPWYRHFTRGLWHGYLLYFFVATVTIGVTGSIYEVAKPAAATGYSRFRPPYSTGYTPTYRPYRPTTSYRAS